MNTEKKKKRTRADVEREYQMEALALGHKTRLHAELEQEIPAHLDRLKKLAKESQLMPEEVAEKPAAEKPALVETPVPLHEPVIPPIVVLGEEEISQPKESA